MSSTPLWTIAFLLAAPTGAPSDSGAPGDSGAPSDSGAELVDFDTQVVPILTKAGCNAAACHGTADGRGGFGLSLFGADPAADLKSIVHALEGRRVNLAAPEDSLLIAKPSGFIDHGGGLRFADDGPEAEVLTRWIAQGAQRRELRQLVDLSIRGVPFFAQRVPARTRLTVEALFDDGRRRDVTRQTVIAPVDPAAVEVGDLGRLTLKRPGEQVVMLHFMSAVRAVTLASPLGARPIQVSAAAEASPIDRMVVAKLKRLRLPLSPPADDLALLRRVSLDLAGRLPTPDQLARYEADALPRRYERTVDQLLASEQFTEFWTFQLCRQLRVRSQPADRQGAATFYAWLRGQVADQRPWSETVAQLINAEGDSHEYGPANFYRFADGPRGQAEYLSEVLLGVRIRCANCHNHPLDRWTQDDYHGLAAIFAGLQRGRVIRATGRGEVIHPRTGEAARPRIPGQRFLEPPTDGRGELSEWLTSSDNPYFARSLVNRLWKAMMGRGLVEPIDDLRATNPPTHPELLDHLARDFIEHQFDLRHTLRQIALSAAYRRSSRELPGNASDNRYYSHFIARPLAAEVLLDAVADVTGVAESYEGQPPGTRAIALYDLRSPAPTLDVLGRCEVGDACQPGGAASGLTSQLHRINGAVINGRVASRKGRLHQWIARGDSNRQIVDQCYRRALGRGPTDRERDYWDRQLAAADRPADRIRQLEDFCWGVLNCREFVTNH